jgi:serine acetyltransferase
MQVSSCLSKNCAKKSYFSKILDSVWQLGYLPSAFLKAYREDPALRGKSLAVLELFTYAGLWAILFHRVAHILFTMKIPLIPRKMSPSMR